MSRGTVKNGQFVALEELGGFMNDRELVAPVFAHDDRPFQPFGLYGHVHQELSSICGILDNAFARLKA